MEILLRCVLLTLFFAEGSEALELDLLEVRDPLPEADEYWWDTLDWQLLFDFSTIEFEELHIESITDSIERRRVLSLS